MRGSGRKRATVREGAERRSALLIPVAAVVTVWVLFGGAAPESVLLFAMLALSGTAMVVLLIWHAGWACWQPLPWPARLAMAFFVLMPLLQMIPLPPDLWQALPGRALATQTLGAVGSADEWHPLTLAVEQTFRTLLVFVWLAAILLACLQLSTSDLRRIFALILILGLLNVAIGVVQVVSNNTLLVFHKGFAGRFLTGLFANKNHTGLFIAMTFLFGYGALYAKRGWDGRHVAIVVSGVLVLLIALLATFSRAGIVFGLAAIAFLVVLSSSHRLSTGLRYLLLAIPILGAGLFAAVSLTDLGAQSVGRFGGIVADQRWDIWQWSWPLVLRYFPFGSGIGSFPAVFPSAEQLAWVRPTYVNHVHNDYMEQLIEVGIAAPISWVLLAAALAGPVRMAWAQRTGQSGRLALLGAAALFLIAVHSLFDYPLRRPAIPVAAMVALAAVLRIAIPRSRTGNPISDMRQVD